MAKRPDVPDTLTRHVTDDIFERLESIKNKIFHHALIMGGPPSFLTKLDCHPGIRDKIPWITVCDLGFGGEGPKSFHMFCGDEERLPLQRESFDLIISFLHLHWANDVPGVLAQIRHALKPDGLFLGALYGGETLHELRHAWLEAELSHMGAAAPRVSPFMTIQQGADLLQRARFSRPVADIDRWRLAYSTPLELFKHLHLMGESNALYQRTHKPVTRGLLKKAADIYGEKFSDDDKRVKASFDLLYLTGWGPQQS